jgi:RNA polymerase sigma-70 factor (ECF subfamily)
VALNRAVAIAQRHGPQRGLEEISAIEDVRRLAKYPFYHAALAEFEFGIGQPEKAREHFANALSLARNEMERSFFEQRIISCK